MKTDDDITGAADKAGPPCVQTRTAAHGTHFWSKHGSWRRVLGVEHEHHA